MHKKINILTLRSACTSGSQPAKEDKISNFVIAVEEDPSRTLSSFEGSETVATTFISLLCETRYAIICCRLSAI